MALDASGAGGRDARLSLFLWPAGLLIVLVAAAAFVTNVSIVNNHDRPPPLLLYIHAAVSAIWFPLFVVQAWQLGSAWAVTVPPHANTPNAPSVAGPAPTSISSSIRQSIERSGQSPLGAAAGVGVRALLAGAQPSGQVRRDGQTGPIEALIGAPCAPFTAAEP